ncbi:hypothetical protein FUAX_40810 (plasmid) [Fulvitalea axinellae]|uniref:DUF6046 domain-containing protein n=1 Tax=Fulvitalea axinellae TaxID=1182444 RepID=A0AAU9CYR7_9BACT|nr:hypothetical protein FUAX_40810 [Fulvitalea axinellae]
MAEFDLNGLYEEVAGYRGYPFPVDLDKLPKAVLEQQRNRYRLLTGQAVDGQPVIAPVTLGDVALGHVEEGKTTVGLQPMVVLEGKKRIVKSVIAGGLYDGTVKEFINFDDYKIRVFGVLANRKTQGAYPVDEADLLKGLWLRNESLFFSNVATDGLFENVVITDIKLKELNKAPGMQLYEIKAISDSTLDAERLKGNAKT